jgi:hypothetical protein
MSDAGRAEAAALALCRYYDVLRPESDRGKVTPDECDYGQASEVLAAADACDREHGIVRVDTQDEAAIEAAAKAIHEAVEAQCVNLGMRIKWGSKQQDEATRNSYREQARAALTAAAAVGAQGEAQ